MIGDIIFVNNPKKTNESVQEHAKPTIPESPKYSNRKIGQNLKKYRIRLLGFGIVGHH